MQALNKAKQSMKISLYGVILKLIIMSVLSICHIGIYSLVISEIVNIIFVVGLNYLCLKRIIKWVIHSKTVEYSLQNEINLMKNIISINL